MLISSFEEATTTEESRWAVNLYLHYPSSGANPVLSQIDEGNQTMVTEGWKSADLTKPVPIPLDNTQRTRLLGFRTRPFSIYFRYHLKVCLELHQYRSIYFAGQNVIQSATHLTLYILVLTVSPVNSSACPSRHHALGCEDIHIRHGPLYACIGVKMRAGIFCESRISLGILYSSNTSVSYLAMFCSKPLLNVDIFSTRTPDNKQHGCSG